MTLTSTSPPQLTSTKSVEKLLLRQVTLRTSKDGSHPTTVRRQVAADSRPWGQYQRALSKRGASVVQHRQVRSSACSAPIAFSRIPPHHCLCVSTTTGLLPPISQRRRDVCLVLLFSRDFLLVPLSIFPTTIYYVCSSYHLKLPSTLPLSCTTEPL